jgi:hypothetical protein
MTKAACAWTATVMNHHHQYWTKRSQIASMGWESAKELDDAVTILTAPEHPFVTMSVKFRCRLCTKCCGREAMLFAVQIFHSRPEHYRDRIGRDLRQLAVSIAAARRT